MSASDNFITRPVLTTVCSLLIVIGGLIATPPAADREPRPTSAPRR